MADSIVLTFGTFDLFHIGHLRILERAAKLGDKLIVGVSTDELNWFKKQKVPAVPYAQRAAIVGAMRCVDHVFPEESLEAKRRYLEEHNASVLVMGDDWEGRFDEFKDICKVVYLPRTKNISSTLLKEQIAGSHFTS
jgi:choline-phosphate cytidylyltransferase